MTVENRTDRALARRGASEDAADGAPGPGAEDCHHLLQTGRPRAPAEEHGPLTTCWEPESGETREGALAGSKEVGLAPLSPGLQPAPQANGCPLPLPFPHGLASCLQRPSGPTLSPVLLPQPLSWEHGVSARCQGPLPGLHRPARHPFSATAPAPQLCPLTHRRGHTQPLPSQPASHSPSGRLPVHVYAAGLRRWLNTGPGVSAKV